MPNRSTLPQSNEPGGGVRTQQAASAEAAPTPHRRDLARPALVITHAIDVEAEAASGIASDLEVDDVALVHAHLGRESLDVRVARAIDVPSGLDRPRRCPGSEVRPRFPGKQSGVPGSPSATIEVRPAPDGRQDRAASPQKKPANARPMTGTASRTSRFATDLMIQMSFDTRRQSAFTQATRTPGLCVTGKGGSVRLEQRPSQPHVRRDARESVAYWQF